MELAGDAGQGLDKIQSSYGEQRDAIINYVKGQNGLNQSDDLVKITVSHSNLKVLATSIYSHHLSGYGVSGKVHRTSL